MPKNCQSIPFENLSCSFRFIRFNFSQITSKFNEGHKNKDENVGAKNHSSNHELICFYRNRNHGPTKLGHPPVFELEFPGFVHTYMFRSEVNLKIK